MLTLMKLWSITNTPNISSLKWPTHWRPPNMVICHSSWTGAKCSGTGWTLYIMLLGFSSKSFLLAEYQWFCDGRIQALVIQYAICVSWRQKSQDPIHMKRISCGTCSEKCTDSEHERNLKIYQGCQQEFCANIHKLIVHVVHRTYWIPICVHIYIYICIFIWVWDHWVSARNATCKMLFCLVSTNPHIYTYTSCLWKP